MALYLVSSQGLGGTTRSCLKPSVIPHNTSSNDILSCIEITGIKRSLFPSFSQLVKVTLCSILSSVVF